MAVATAAPEAAVKEELRPILRSAYKPVPYLTSKVDLTFVLGEEVTRVTSRLHLKPNPAAVPETPLLFNGRPDVKLASIKIGGQPLEQGKDYELTDKTLTLTHPPAGEFDLEVVTDIKPQENTLLEGLYKSGGNFCSQNEAEGFRGITFFQDRPDVMAVYTTRIEADKALYPVLLSNGNLMETGDLPGGRHFAVWHDPFPKPCYLFALVAGNLEVSKREFTTVSGRTVELRIYVQQQHLHKVGHAMDSLVKAMRWDEETFGLEYDLDLFNIVAVDDFNMGAMENKSLNVFNSSLVLASPSTSTDSNYNSIEGVVAHEYFHNWTGNRVTCRDWFQLTLKEGLTVYRDQEFTSDMNSRAVKRIDDASYMRTGQFTEDAGPLAHPVRPDSYLKMDNFYTGTVYEKGAEVIRLYRTVLGVDGFRKGMDLYFKRHDGQAVTCDDFLAAMADANNTDLTSLGKWYSQAGTPLLHVSTSYDAAAQTYTITAKQSHKPTAAQPNKVPVLIPIKVGLLGPDGKDLQLTLQGTSTPLGTTTVLRLEEEEQSFTFTGIAAEPVPSLLRDFSAPVKLTVEGQTDEQLVFLLAHDSDPFTRWEAGQRLALKLLLVLYHAAKDDSKGASLQERCEAVGGVPDSLVAAYRSLLVSEGLDGAFLAQALSLPRSSELEDKVPNMDPVLAYHVRSYVRKHLAAKLRPELEALKLSNSSPANEAYVFNAEACARRSAKNTALALLTSLEEPELIEDALHRFRTATNMTDQMSALSALVETSASSSRAAALSEFYEKWKHEPLIMLKWLSVQASSNTPGNVALVKQLVDHPAFVITNPNSCYSLFLGFARSTVNFHAADGSGYEFMADSVIKVDDLNHQVAARMATSFTSWRLYDTGRQELMRAAQQRILAKPGLSDNLFEIVTKSLE